MAYNHWARYIAKMSLIVSGNDVFLMQSSVSAGRESTETQYILLVFLACFTFFVLKPYSTPVTNEPTTHYPFICMRITLTVIGEAVNAIAH